MQNTAACRLPRGMNLQAEMKEWRMLIVMMGLSVTNKGLVIFNDLRKYLIFDVIHKMIQAVHYKVSLLLATIFTETPFITKKSKNAMTTLSETFLIFLLAHTKIQPSSWIIIDNIFWFLVWRLPSVVNWFHSWNQQCTLGLEHPLLSANTQKKEGGEKYFKSHYLFLVNQEGQGPI